MKEVEFQCSNDLRVKRMIKTYTSYIMRGTMQKLRFCCTLGHLRNLFPQFHPSSKMSLKNCP